MVSVGNGLTYAQRTEPAEESSDAQCVRTVGGLRAQYRQSDCVRTLEAIYPLQA